MLRVVRETGEPLRALAAPVTRYPQALENVPVRARPPLTELKNVGAVVERWEKALEGRGRILVRYSGTEPVARVMVEGDDPAAIETAVREIRAAIQAEIGAAP